MADTFQLLFPSIYTFNSPLFFFFISFIDKNKKQNVQQKEENGKIWETHQKKISFIYITTFMRFIFIFFFSFFELHTFSIVTDNKT